MQYRGRLFTGRHIASGRHVQALPSTRRPSRHVTSGRHSAAVDKEAVTSRHVTSRHVTSREDVTGCRRGQGGRQNITGAAVDKDAVTSRHVRTSRRGHVRMPGRHVTSRHVTSRHVTTSGAPREDHAQQ